MQIRAGYELIYQCPQPTPMVVTLRIHPTRASDIVKPDDLSVSPTVPVTSYQDSFGNWCTRIVAPPGLLRLTSDAVVSDAGNVDRSAPWVGQRPVESLPEDTLLFLLGSRYCETDLLSEAAWQLFGATTPGWPRVQAICDFVHNHITFGYGLSSPTKTAFQAYSDRQGRMPRFHAPGRHILPLHEYSGAILHRLPRRHRPPPSLCADGLRGVVRGLSRRWVVHLRRAKQCAPDRADPDRARQRRRGRCAHDQLRAVEARKLQGVDG